MLAAPREIQHPSCPLTDVVRTSETGEMRPTPYLAVAWIVLLSITTACGDAIMPPDRPDRPFGGDFQLTSAASPDIVVTTTSDVADIGGAQQVGDLPGLDGLVSLREAIQAANNTAGSQVIGFAIPTSDAGFDETVFTIRPTSFLPELTDDGTHINGATQTDFSGNTNEAGPEVAVDFSLQGDGTGFKIASGYNSIHGLTITSAQVMGLRIRGPSAVHNRVTGCFIVENGTGRHGGEDGVGIGGGASHNIVGGTSSAERNVISGNLRAGILISGGPDPNATHDNIVIGNFIGTDFTGSQAWPNGAEFGIGGIAIFWATNNRIGGFNPGEGNLISGNEWIGVGLNEGSSNGVVAGNLIGTDITGTERLGNKTGGLEIRGEPYSLNASYANVIARNVISGNRGFGVLLWRGAHHNAIEGNLIGTDVTGMRGIGNDQTGVIINVNPHDNVIGGYSAASRNIISANGFGGVRVNSAQDNQVLGNYIGADANGIPTLGNLLDGVMIRSGSQRNRVGAEDPGAGNLIAGNARAGVAVTSDGFVTNQNRISGNSVHSNGGPGIDLNGDEVTSNDLGDIDAGPNELMNFPVLTSAKATPGQLVVRGMIDTPNPRTVTVEFFANPVPTPGGDPTGHGEGAIFLGATRPNALGLFTATFGPVSPGTLITATATDASGNTSEFAANIEARL